MNKVVTSPFAMCESCGKKPAEIVWEFEDGMIFLVCNTCSPPIQPGRIREAIVHLQHR